MWKDGAHLGIQLSRPVHAQPEARLDVLDSVGPDILSPLKNEKRWKKKDKMKPNTHGMCTMLPVADGTSVSS